MVRISKKGFFLTIVSLLSITLIYLSLQVGNIQKDYTVDSSGSIRAASLDLYVQDLENVYLPNILLIATRQALAGMNNFIIETNSFFTVDEIQNAFYQITSNGTLLPDSSTLFVNDSIRNLTRELQELTAEEYTISINISYTNVGYEIYQVDPWFVGARMLFIVNVSDSQTRWVNKTIYVNIQTPIQGLYDPYYLINTQGLHSPRIQNASTITGTWTIGALYDHLVNERYVAKSSGIAYLDRFLNSSQSSPYGLESLINPGQISQLVPVNKSYIDRYFWAEWDCSIPLQELYEVDSISDDVQLEGFRLDPITLVSYTSPTEYLNNKTLVCP